MNELLTDPELIKAIQILGAKLKSSDELVMLNSELTKITIEAALNGEMNAHLGCCEKHSTEGDNTENSRNGYNKKQSKVSMAK